MANEVYSKEVAVEVDMGYPSAADWKLAVCTTSKSLSDTTNTVTVNSDCEGTFVRQLPTDEQWTMSFEGYVNSNPGVDELSSNELIAVKKSRAVRPFRFRNGDDSYYREGIGFISQLDETGSVGEYLTFSITVTGSENYVTSPAT